MSIGFSIGDFTAVLQLANNTRKRASFSLRELLLMHFIPLISEQNNRSIRVHQMSHLGFCGSLEAA